MKKIVSLIVVSCAALTLGGCNRTLFDTNYTFNKAIITVGSQTYCYNIKSWRDYEGEQLQITLEDGSVILVSSYNTILINTNGDGTSTIIEKANA